MKHFLLLVATITLCTQLIAQVVKKTNANLPITVKPSNKKTTSNQDPKNLPITVNPGQQTQPKTSASKSLPITVKPGDVFYAANFAADSLGDMPRGWRTKSIGEVVDP